MNDGFPKEHPRAKIVRLAKAEIGLALARAVGQHDLTRVEVIRIITGACHDYVADVTKYMLREERHGDEDKPADRE